MARYADVYMLWGEPLAQARERLEQTRAAAARHGRTLRFSLSVRPILAPTEAQAWARAEEIAEQALAQRQRFLGARGRREDSSVGSARLRAAAAESDVHDRRLWTKVAAITGAAGNSTALVGTPEQVAEALLAYVDLGFDTLLIRGFHPLQDAIDYGRELIPLVRAEVARRDAHAHSARAQEATRLWQSRLLACQAYSPVDLRGLVAHAAPRLAATASLRIRSQPIVARLGVALRQLLRERRGDRGVSMSNLASRRAVSIGPLSLRDAGLLPRGER